MNERITSFRGQLACWRAAGRPGMPFLCVDGIEPQPGRCCSCGGPREPRAFRCRDCLSAVVAVLAELDGA